MNIAEFSKSDITGGGASRVAEELAIGLRSTGVMCDHWSRLSSAGFDASTRFSLYGGWTSKHFSRLHRLFALAGYPELLPLELISIIRHGWREYDIFHFHDLSGAVSPYTLRWLSKRSPVIWTFHDCSPFTAGCLYPMDCDHYKLGCGNCPQLRQWPLVGRFDHTRTLAKIKRDLHATKRIVTIAPSAWMADMAVESGVVQDRPRVIPNGVDVNVFRPNDARSEAKAFLGIHKDRPVILISANSLADKRKGAAYSFEAVRAVRDLNPFVIAVGRQSKDIDVNLAGIDHLCTGFISDQRLLARWYSLADVFVFCSLADNMPLAVLETMACGVPIVGFKTGGIPEMVVQDETGYLVDRQNQNELNSILRNALTSHALADWGRKSRLRVEQDYSMSRFISAHKSLYNEVVELFKERHANR